MNFRLVCFPKYVLLLFLLLDCWISFLLGVFSAVGVSSFDWMKIRNLFRKIFITIKIRTMLFFAGLVNMYKSLTWVFSTISYLLSSWTPSDKRSKFLKSLRVAKYLMNFICLQFTHIDVKFGSFSSWSPWDRVYHTKRHDMVYQVNVFMEMPSSAWLYSYMSTANPVRSKRLNL